MFKFKNFNYSSTQTCFKILVFAHEHCVDPVYEVLVEQDEMGYWVSSVLCARDKTVLMSKRQSVWGAGDAVYRALQWFKTEVIRSFEELS